ncbi:MAG TPA: hypothetical protein VN982_04760 [Candidatus Dormibacteraeota bacterium]|nr:hypothetical protein [Candidatus Dormibacteraeota bacterium]
MIDAFDIFRAQADGSVLWRESASTLDRANVRIRQLAAGSPGDYILVNQQTGTKLVVLDPFKATNPVVIQ